MIRLKVTPVVGLPQFTGWSQVAESTSSASTRLVSVFAISGKHAGNVGRDVSDKISDFYYYDVKQFHEFIEDLAEFVEKDGCKLFISCALINGGKSVFATRGGSVFLKRKEKAGKILFSENKTKIVSGNYTDDDVFVLTTYQASQFLNEIEQKFSQGFDVDIIITSVVPGLHAQIDSSLSAIVFINKVLESSKKSLGDEVNVSFVESDKLGKPEDKAGLFKRLRNQKPKLKPKAVEITTDLSKFGRVVGTFFKKSSKFISSRVQVKNINFEKFLFLIKYIKSKDIKKLILVAVVFSMSLSAVLFMGFKNRKEKENISSLLIPIQEKIIVAKEKLDDDPISSRDIVIESISSLKKIKEDNKDSSAVSLIEDQLIEVSEFYEEISGKEELDELDVFYDLRLVKSDYIANDLDVNGGQLVLLDSEKKQVINLNISTKKVSVRDFSDFDRVKDLSASNNTVFVLSDGINSFELEEGGEIKEVRGLGDSNRNATFINSYDRFVYVLSPDKRNVYRYSGDGDGSYSEPIGWMTSATGLKYDEITSFSVDGDIWFSTSGGQIKKFTGGKESSFEIRGLEDPFSSSIKVFTNGNQENIYVLESDKNRVVVLSKEGEFKREIKSVSFSTVGSIAVSEELGKIFAVSGSIVFEVDLGD